MNVPIETLPPLTSDSSDSKSDRELPPSTGISIQPIAPARIQVTEAELRKCFIKIDADGSGKLTKQEIKQFYAKHGRVLTEQELDDAICFADSDRDNQLDLAEFTNAYMCGQETIQEDDDSKDNLPK